MARVSSSWFATVGRSEMVRSCDGTRIVQPAGYVAPVSGLVQCAVTATVNADPARCSYVPSAWTSVPYTSG